MPKWMTMMSLLAGAVAAFAGVPAAHAHSGRPYSVTVESESGAHLPSFYQGGQVFVLGQYGERYNIRVRNHTARRVEAVVTVDGRDVVSGDPGDYVRQRGYVLPAYGDVLIEGFRQNMSQVAAFRFTSPGDSYSARRGTPQNVGVIGVAFFAERHVPPPAPPIALPRPYDEHYDHYDHYGQQGYRGRSEARRSAPSGGVGTGSAAAGRSAPAPAAEASADAMPRSSSARAYRGESEESDSNIGTQYGESRYNEAREVTFVRASQSRPDFVSTLRYDDANGLMARGIEIYPRPAPRPYVQVYPEAFPANRFAPPPP